MGRLRVIRQHQLLPPKELTALSMGLRHLAVALETTARTRMVVLAVVMAVVLALAERAQQIRAMQVEMV
jgi:hypothetical protein